jgi:hypothetical protein
MGKRMSGCDPQRGSRVAYREGSKTIFNGRNVKGVSGYGRLDSRS